MGEAAGVQVTHTLRPDAYRHSSPRLPSLACRPSNRLFNTVVIFILIHPRQATSDGIDGHFGGLR